MNAIIYTQSDLEYEALERIINGVHPNMDIERAPLQGHKYYHVGYDLIVVALEGAEGMEVVSEYSSRYARSQIIWVTSDRHFAATAMRLHIFDFILRPYEEERITKALGDALKQNAGRNQWTM